MVHHFLRMKASDLVDLQEHMVIFPGSISVEQNHWGRLQGTVSQCLVASAAFRLLGLTEKTFLEVRRRQGGLVCLRVGLSSINSRGTLVAGPPPSSSSLWQCCDISNFPEAQGRLSKVDSNTFMIRNVQKRTRS